MPTHTVYDNMVFPDREYVEYPKAIYLDSPDGSYAKATDRTNTVTVYDEAEEREALETRKEIVREEDEKARLVLLAETKGVKHDKRWGIDRLRSVIAGAGHDPDFDPRA